MIDTHSHLYFNQFDEDRDEVMARTLKALEAVILIGVDAQTNIDAVELAHKYENANAVIGFNPGAAVESYERDGSFGPMIDALNELVHSSKKVVGIGEIGLDYHWPQHSSAKQKEYQAMGFREQINFARERDLPIVIHSRDAYEDTKEVLRDYTRQSDFKGVWHSFVDGVERMNQVTGMGLFIGINAIVTYPTAQELRRAVGAMSLEQLLLETDAPYLSPQSMRGQRNESINVRIVADEISRVRKQPLQDIESVTDKNARRLFGLGTIG